MKTGEPDRSLDLEVEAQFSQYLEARARGDAGEDFDTFCRARPDLEQRLRAVHAQWLSFQSFSRQVAERFGSNVDPELSLETPPRASDPTLEDQQRAGGVPVGLGRRYTRREEIARGGMGAVYNVWDADLRRSLAMKVMLRAPAGEARDRALMARFLEEARITGQLDHPGVVPVHELGVDAEGQPFFTMKLVQGEDLKHLLDRVRRNEEGWTKTRALGVLLKACEALAFAHSKGVVHRDLKPANIMVGRFGEVFVMDWGVAKILEREDSHDLRLRQPLANSGDSVRTDREEARAGESDSPLVTMDGTVIGTPFYMPPEQAAGRIEDLGPHSDVYALGAMLYELLSGRRPYERPGEKTSPQHVLRALLARAPTPVGELNPDVPAELVAICEKAMERDPRRRYRDMVAMDADLRAFLENRVVQAYETGALAQLRKWVKRNRGLAATAALAVLLALGGLGSTSYVQAKANTEITSALGVARENERIATLETSKVLRLSDARRLSQLEKRADELWPATAARVTALEAWVQDAQRLVKNLGEHRATLDELRVKALPELAAVTAEPAGDRRVWRFADMETQWQHDLLAELIEDLSAFAGPDPKEGQLVEVQGRLEFARTVHVRTIDEHRDEWENTIASIRDRGQCPQYDGLVIVPHLGLVPLGRDPQSGLFEFAHLQTGLVPRREADGRLDITAESGLVFMLLPGGTFRMGAVKPSEDQESGPNIDPQAQADEGPVHAVTLAPFFMSKYEMTQGQWLRFMHENPSHYKPGTPAGEHAITLLNPVEFVDWNQCKLALERLGLMLPTEAQWEYAARAGTTSVRWTGDDREALRGAANIADQSAKRAGMDLPTIKDWPELDDGYPVHAPVDAFRPNPFGLHNVLGNLWEWCRDGHEKTYTAKNQEGDGEALVQGAVFRVCRGGSSNLSAEWVRSARRMQSPPVGRYDWLGVRPARTVTPTLE